MLKNPLWKMNTSISRLRDALSVKDRESVIIFDTSMFSNNKGDHVIKFYCDKVLEDCLGNRHMIRVPTHQLPTGEELKVIQKTSMKIVCGTNILSPNIGKWSLWKFPDNLLGYTNVVALGIGWGYYSNYITDKSKSVYQHIFSKSGLHSVRDSYTEEKMNQMGIHNVVNTGCPTMWELTPEVCKSIPHGKAPVVITTLTDYSRDLDEDNFLFETLSRYYERVYIWLQGSQDAEYLKQLNPIRNQVVVSGNLNVFSEILLNTNIDYVGTRLHAGIHALNCGVRTMIIAVDNRALEIANDTSLPVISRKSIRDLLPTAITQNRATNIQLPWENIHRWKSQFTLI